MPFNNSTPWIRLCLFNLLIVAVLGTLMRYKIGYSFPYLDQKYLQHAHSHFAFSGWVSLLLMVLMVKELKNKLGEDTSSRFTSILFAYTLCSYGMLFSFMLQGYGFFSIGFSTASIICFFVYAWQYYSVAKSGKADFGKQWFMAALSFGALSTAGTFYLSYIMASGSFQQNLYLGSVYWYLHFQYNGWFFFACAGLFVNYLQQKQIITKPPSLIFWVLLLSCIPAYGLSVLWLNLPGWLYMMVVIAASAQFSAWAGAAQYLLKKVTYNRLQLNTAAKLLLLSACAALTIKLILQLGSVVPAISKLAFGFRPVVIAYLHLVLLAFVSLFLLGYLYITKNINPTKLMTVGLMLFMSGVVLNEIALAVQGIASFSYTVIPCINQILLSAALIIFASLLLINKSCFGTFHNESQAL